MIKNNLHGNIRKLNYLEEIFLSYRYHTPGLKEHLTTYTDFIYDDIMKI